jgi:uncharacterized protein (DUF934 family)
MSEPKPLLAPLQPVQAHPRLWRDNQFVADIWTNVTDGDAFPFSEAAVISLQRWRAEQTNLAALAISLGIRLSPGDVLEPVADNVQRLDLIVLPFAKFTDGRNYSTARRLREAGFKGEIRAAGDVLLDQLPLLLRSGFTAFEITHKATLVALEAAPIPAVSRVYQSGAEIDAKAWRSRRVQSG